MKQMTEQLTLLELVGLKDYGNRSVDSLSGGESQRVALARVLAPEPKLVLLDEPFNSLDRSLRRSLVDQVFEILRAKKITSIHVTHEGDEASLFSDSIIIIENGQIINQGTFAEVIDLPMNVLSADLLGLRTIWVPDAHFQDNNWIFRHPGVSKNITDKSRRGINFCYDLIVFNYRMMDWKPLLLRLSMPQDRSIFIAA